MRETGEEGGGRGLGNDAQVTRASIYENMYLSNTHPSRAGFRGAVSVTMNSPTDPVNWLLHVSRSYSATPLPGSGVTAHEGGHSS